MDWGAIGSLASGCFWDHGGSSLRVWITWRFMDLASQVISALIRVISMVILIYNSNPVSRELGGFSPASRKNYRSDQGPNAEPLNPTPPHKPNSSYIAFIEFFPQTQEPLQCPSRSFIDDKPRQDPHADLSWHGHSGLRHHLRLRYRDEVRVPRVV